jgi:hypothetical protein
MSVVFLVIKNDRDKKTVGHAGEKHAGASGSSAFLCMEAAGQI